MSPYLVLVTIASYFILLFLISYIAAVRPIIRDFSSETVNLRGMWWLLP